MRLVHNFQTRFFKITMMSAPQIVVGILVNKGPSCIGLSCCLITVYDFLFNLYLKMAIFYKLTHRCLKKVGSYCFNGIISDLCSCTFARLVFLWPRNFWRLLREMFFLNVLPGESMMRKPTHNVNLHFYYLISQSFPTVRTNFY